MNSTNGHVELLEVEMRFGSRYSGTIRSVIHKVESMQRGNQKEELN